MEVEISVHPDDIIKKTADDRGRVNLGLENAGKEVRVAVLEIEE